MVPKRVDEAIKHLRYVDYSLLSHSARELPAKEDDGLFLSNNGRVEIRGKTMTVDNEKDMGEIDWMAAAETVEKRTREYHGDGRANPLASHHRNVLVLARRYNWTTARSYDKRTRDLMANDLRHDPSEENQSLVQQAALESEALKLKSAFFAQPPPQYFPNFHPPAFPSPPSIPSYSSTSKRFQPYDPKNRQNRSNRPNPRCFRCGACGHTADSCGSQNTSAGLPCAAWSRRPGRSGGSLVEESSGKTFCFGWEQSSSCRFGNQCVNIHRCTVCGARDHGAQSCPK